MKKVSDEELIAALMEYGTIKAVSAKTGIAARTLYDRMHERTFKALYRAAKADALRGAVSSLNGKVQGAIDTIEEIMDDKENPAALRLQAAGAILAHAEKFAGRLAAGEADCMTTKPQTLAEMLDDI